jgi:hypothetical protein
MRQLKVKTRPKVLSENRVFRIKQNRTQMLTKIRLNNTKSKKSKENSKALSLFKKIKESFKKATKINSNPKRLSAKRERPQNSPESLSPLFTSALMT